MQFQAPNPFVQWLGFELLRCEGGEAELALEPREELTNAWGVVHGGVTMTLLDVVMAQAARSPEVAGGEPQPGVVTVEMKTSFLQPALGRLVAHGNLLHRTASMAFCQASVRGAQGQLIGHATGTFKYLRGLPVPGEGRRIQRLNASD